MRYIYAYAGNIVRLAKIIGWSLGKGLRAKSVAKEISHRESINILLCCTWGGRTSAHRVSLV